MILRPQLQLSSTWLLALLVAFLATLVSVSADKEPSVSHTLFDNLPSRIVYFEDTSVSSPCNSRRSICLTVLLLSCPLQVILYHDAVARNIWRSDDEGTTWKGIQGVPNGEAWSIVEHPFNSRTVSCSWSFMKWVASWPIALRVEGRLGYL